MPDKTTNKTPDFVDDEKPKEETLWEYLTRTADAKFVDSIPLESIKELPTEFMYFFGALAHLMTLVCFIYFIYTGYHAARSIQFISLNKNDGECKDVMKEVDGLYYGDTNGKWSGDAAFDPSLGQYFLELNNFEATEDEFSDIMNEVYQELEILSKGAYLRDLAENMLLWMTWETILPHTKTVNKFHMMGNPLIIFSRDNQLGLFTSVDGECTLPSQAAFDESTGKFSLQYNVTQFRQNPYCISAIEPEHLGYVHDYHYDKFEIKVDTNTVAIAAAVNSGIIDISQLNAVAGSNVTFHYNGTTFTITEMFADRYPGMDTTACLIVNDQNFCVIRMGQTYGFPFLNHFGTDNGFPEPCECPADSKKAGKISSYCHNFDFMLGLLFYNLPTGADYDDDNDLPQLPLAALALLELMMTTNNIMLNKMAYNASWAASMFNTEEYTKVVTPEWRQDAFRFCLYLPSSAVSVLPVETQIKATSSATFVPVAMFLLLPLLYLYLQVTGHAPPKEEYAKSELDAAVETLALVMLRIRDGKVRGITPNGILKQLTSELVHSSRAEGGFPDSDDESDSDEEGDVEKGGHKSRPLPPNGQIELKKPLKSHVFVRPKESPKQTEEKSFWGSLFGDTSSTPSGVIGSSASNPMTAQNKDLIVLNEIPGTDPAPGFGRPSVRSVTNASLMKDMVDKLNTTIQKAVAVKDLDGGGAVYRTAQNKAVELKKFDLRIMAAAAEDGELDTLSLFTILYNTMLLHASLALQCDLRTVDTEQGDVVAYNIGGRIYTARQVQALGKDTSMFILSVGISSATLERKR